MIRSVPSDLLYVCAELLTGKSVPLLVAIAVLPVAQALAWVMVTLGAVAGTLFTAYTAHYCVTGGVLGAGNRLLQLGFSLFLSLTLFLSLAAGIHPRRGPSLAAIPAFCLAAHTVPQRHSTALVAFALGLGAFYACILAEATAANHPPPHHQEDSESAGSVTVVALSLREAVYRALQLFVLAFYACVQHAPTQTYFDVVRRMGGSLRGHPPAVYASHHLARHAPYSLFVGLFAAWLRVCVWSGVCFMRDSHLHAMLEGRPGAGGWPCVLAYMTALLFSAVWTATQLREQVLPRFGLDSESHRLKALLCVAALAAFFRMRDTEALFYATDALAAACVLLTVVSHTSSSSTHADDHHDK